MSGPVPGARVFTPSATPVASLTTSSFPPVNTQPNGSSFLVFVVGSSPTIPTITDSPGNSYSPNGGFQETNDGGYLFWFLSTNGLGQANHTWTAHGTNIVLVAAVEITAEALAAVVDASNSGYVITNPRSIPVVTTLTSDLIVAAAFSGSGFTFSPAAAFTPLGTVTGTNFWFEVASTLAAGPGTYDPAWTGTQSQGFVGVTIALKAGATLSSSSVNYNPALQAPIALAPSVAALSVVGVPPAGSTQANPTPGQAALLMPASPPRMGLGISIGAAVSLILGQTAAAISGLVTPVNPATSAVGLLGAVPGLSVAGNVQVPRQLTRGFIQSTSLLIAWWAPATGPAPDSYNVYRNGVLVKTGVVSTATGFGNRQWFIDTGLTPLTAYTYTVTAIIGGLESGASPPLTLTTISAVAGSTVPLLPIPWTPAPFSMPVAAAVTTWLASNNTNNNAPGTGSPGPGQTVTGCGFQYAINNCSYGDIIVLTAGLVYTGTAQNGFVFPGFANGTPGTGINGNYIYVVSSNLANLPLPGLGTVEPTEAAFTCTGASIAAGATSATLTTPWAAKTAINPTVFYESTTFSESRNVKFTQGSTAISWMDGALTNSASPTLQVCVLSGVTPTDIPNMPTVQLQSSVNGGYGITFPGASYIRLSGINVAPFPGDTNNDLYYGIYMPASDYQSLVPLCNYITLDRCVIGSDWTLPSWGLQRHGVSSFCNYFYMDSCYVYGIYDGPVTGSTGGTDGNAVFMLGGSNGIVNNCYLQSSAESIIAGGGFVDHTQIPSSWAFTNNYSHKPDGWAAGTAPAGCVGNWAKNHFEMKVGSRYLMQGNICQNNWNGVAGSQHGRAFVIGTQDQTAGASVPEVQTNPWNFISDVSVLNNKVRNCGSLGYVFYSPTSTTGYTEKVLFDNNLGQCNPAPGQPGGTYPGSGATYGAGGAFNQYYGFQINGPCPDVTLNRASVIANLANANIGNQPYFPAVVYLMASFVGTLPAANAKLERFTCTNNVLDGPYGYTYFTQAGGFAAVSGTTAITASLAANCLFTNNVPVTDATAFPAGNLAHAGSYAALGMANFVSPAQQPLSVGAWDITSGAYATASTIGGPLGFHHVVSLTVVPKGGFPVPQAAVGVKYQLQASVTNSTNQITWSVLSGQGWASVASIGPTTGLISGIPTTIGPDPTTIQAYDTLINGIGYLQI